MKKRLLAWILALVMLAALLPTAVLAEDKPTSGTCGAAGSESSVTWAFENGTLTISGTGAMKDYGGWRGQPWAAFADSITKFVVEEGVTTIGQSATDGEGMIEEYDIAKSVATIKKYGISTYAATKFTLNDNPNFKLVDGVLFSTDGSTLYAYPGGREEIDVYEVPTNVTKINGGAFNGADMKKLIFGNSTINIEPWTFQGCTAEYMELNGTKLSGSESFRHLTKLKVLKIAGGFIPGQFFCGVAWTGGDSTAAIEKIIITELPSGGNAFFLQNKLTTVDLSQCSNAAKASKNFFSGTNASKIAFYFDSDKNAAGFKGTSAYESQNAVFAVLNGGIIPSWEGWYSENFKLATPIRDGYKFTGWYKDAEFKKALGDDEPPVAGQIYYAGWVESEDTIPDKPNNEQMAVDFGTIYSGDTKSETVPFNGKDALQEITSERNYFEAAIDGMTVTIKPAADLQPGTYTDTLYVRTAGGAVHFITVTVKIVPKPADPEPELPSWISALPALDGSKKLPFTDVWRGDWYYDGVRYVYDNDLMNGTSGTEFSPNAATTRGMIVTILARMDGVNTSGTPWYEAGREWAMWNGISDGTNMEGKITREQLAAMLTRYAALKNRDVSAIASISAYADASNVSNWAVDAMRWAVGEGLIQGSNNHLRPQSNATRAEVATILMRFCKLLKK